MLPRRLFMTCSLLLAFLIQLGCSRTARDLPLNQEQARAACREFLQAWQDGETAVALKPRITGRDYAWDAGQKLVKFELLPEEKSDGTNLFIPVELTLLDNHGRERATQTTYIVGTSPVITVFRE